MNTNDGAFDTLGRSEPEKSGDYFAPKKQKREFSESFHGDARSQNTEKSLQNRISEKSKPKKDIPRVSTDSFSEIKISSTGFSPKEEEKIKHHVASLGAAFSKTSYIDDVTYLLVKRVGSPRHAGAINVGIPCLTVQWLQDCYKQRAFLPVEDYMVQCFTGLNVCITQLLPHDRSVIERLVKANGGDYSPKLEKGVTTHLIADKAEGEKYSHAKSWGVQICSAQWVKDCVEMSSWKSEEGYPLKAIREGESASRAIIIASSDDRSERNGSGKGGRPSSGSSSQPVKQLRVAVQDKPKPKGTLQQFQSLEEMSPSKWPPTSTISDSDVFRCDIFFVCGFSNNMRDYCTRVIIAAGGKRHHCLSERVTKVLIGEFADRRLIDEIRRHPTGATPVTLKWVVDTAIQAGDEASRRANKQTNTATLHREVSVREEAINGTSGNVNSGRIDTNNNVTCLVAQKRWASRSARVRQMKQQRKIPPAKEATLRHSKPDEENATAIESKDICSKDDEDDGSSYNGSTFSLLQNRTMRTAGERESRSSTEAPRTKPIPSPLYNDESQYVWYAPDSLNEEFF